ncbi:MAG TPA: hypothetical protein PLY73_08750, partial [Candidatus Ozemobacteraceae bacterium]|nr:hypothetical protein [Candidatus Ozemobacteraceae bacterium]
SGNFVWPFWGLFKRDFTELDGVLVNPDHLPTWSRWGSFVHVHNSNFRFAAGKVEFDHFIIHSSNDLLVRRGATDWMKDLDAACGLGVLSPDSTWVAAPRVFRDEAFRNIRRHFGVSEILTSQAEGTFYRREMFQEIVDVIDRHYDFSVPAENYERVETYYPTLAAKLANRIGRPYVFSELIGLPEIVPEVVELIRSQTLSKATLKEAYRNYRRTGYIPPSPGEWYKKALGEAKKLARAFLQIYRKGSLEKPAVKSALDIDPSTSYDVGHLYGVKRVERYLNHPLRRFIRSLLEKDRAEAFGTPTAQGAIS